MKDISTEKDRKNQTVTYDLGNGRWATLHVRDIEKHGIAKLLQEFINDHPLPRVPVVQGSEVIGTVPAGWHPLMIKSTSFFYQPREGDFRRDGDKWIASNTLGPGDFEAIPGFVWSNRG